MSDASESEGKTTTARWMLDYIVALFHFGLHQFGFSKDSFLIPVRNCRPVGSSVAPSLSCRYSLPCSVRQQASVRSVIKIRKCGEC